MEIRSLTADYAVSPQLEQADMAAVKAAGYVAIINNRPDAEVMPFLYSKTMQEAAEAEGIAFFANPIIGGMLTMENVTAQSDAIKAAGGPVLAYCASGNRSSIVWALTMAGQMPTDDLIAIPARYGYQLEGLRGQLDAMA